MIFLVYEQDPFVCTDICESLLAAFPEREVLAVQTLDALQDRVARNNDPKTVIMALSSEEMAVAKQIASSICDATRFVIVAAERPVLYDNLDHASFVQKPFSSQGLISVIRDGFVDLRAVQ